MPYVVGLDLGQAQDWTALCVIEKLVRKANEITALQPLPEPPPPPPPAEPKKYVVRSSDPGFIEHIIEKEKAGKMCGRTAEYMLRPDKNVDVSPHDMDVIVMTDNPKNLEEIVGAWKAQMLYQSETEYLTHDEVKQTISHLHPLRAGDVVFDEDAPQRKRIPLVNEYACVAVKRWALGTSYVDIVRDVKIAMQQIPKSVLVVDHSGPGRPVVDMFRRAELQCPLIPVTITGGAGYSISGGDWHVSKQELISTTQVLIQTKRLGFVPG